MYKNIINGINRWILPTNHKDIGTLYIIFAGFSCIMGIFIICINLNKVNYNEANIWQNGFQDSVMEMEYIFNWYYSILIFFFFIFFLFKFKQFFKKFFLPMILKINEVHYYLKNILFRKDNIFLFFFLIFFLFIFFKLLILLSFNFASDLLANENEDNNIIVNNFIYKENNIFKRLPFEEIDKNYKIIKRNNQIVIKSQEKSNIICDFYDLEKKDKKKIYLNNLFYVNTKGFNTLIKLDLDLTTILENKNRVICKIHKTKTKQIKFNREIGIIPVHKIKYILENKIKYILENKRMIINNEIGIIPMHKIKYILEKQNKTIPIISKRNNYFFYNSLNVLKRNMNISSNFLFNFNKINSKNKLEIIEYDIQYLKNLKKNVNNLTFFFFRIKNNELEKNEIFNKINVNISHYINGIKMYSRSFKDPLYFLPLYNYNNLYKEKEYKIIPKRLFNTYLGNLRFFINDVELKKKYTKNNLFLKKEKVYENFLKNYHEYSKNLYITSNRFLYNLNIQIKILEKLKKENIDFNLNLQYEDYKNYNEALKKIFKEELEILEFNYLNFFITFHDSFNSSNPFLWNPNLIKIKNYNNKIICLKDELDNDLSSLIQLNNSSSSSSSSNSSSSSRY